jgi:hypothetical protein
MEGMKPNASWVTYICFENNIVYAGHWDGSFGGFFVLKIVVLFLMRGWSHIFTIKGNKDGIIKLVTGYPAK